MDQITALLLFMQVWLGIGLPFAIAFVVFGIQRIDPAAVHSKWGVRLILIPGVAIFWPRLLWLWIGGRELPVERSAHRNAADRGDV